MRCDRFSAFRVLIIMEVIFHPCVDAFFKTNANDRHCFNFDSACSQCIREPFCQWCAQSKQANNSEHRCFGTLSDLSHICNEIENPVNSPVQTLKNDPFTEGKKKLTDYTNIIQLSPQHIKLKLRRGVAVNFTVSYRQVNDYPLDLYYLMDLSKSMAEDKNTLAGLGQQLASTMRNLTSQFKIGFGSFVDKVMLPFTNIHPDILRTPCKDMNCATPFSFRNNLKLSEKDNEFTEQVRQAQISSNLDSPEGGFDALMQAMVCEKEIGWRKNVRKIIVFSTDALFHFAGDGKLAGVIQPNDGQCYLNEDGYYDKYDLFDYPSISQIDEVAQNKGINIIFAVKGNTDTYKRLSERIKDSAYGELDRSSTNVIKLVADVYKSITDTVKIDVKTRSRDNFLSARFFSDCGVLGAPKELTNMCNNVKEGSAFDFTVEIMVTDCPKDNSRKTSVTVGTLQDSLLVDVDLLCDCDCENPNHEGYEEDSASCSGKGTKQCEVCSCHPGFYGEKCQCSSDKATSNFISDQSKCRPEGSTSNDSVCSGRGRCECETCICWKERHYGRFCQCDKGMCLQHVSSNIECSGNGRCDCNICVCILGWDGQFCECKSKQHCIPKNSRNPCSENGECNCGKCECNVPYTGKYCEECPSCEKGKCLEFRFCVQCQVWGSGPMKGEACKNCSKIQTLPSLANPLSQYALLCTFMDEVTGCDFNFTYKYIDEGYQIFAQKNQKCPEKIDILAVTFGVIGGIVAIGLLTLLIWKILTTIHDKREFQRFEKESQNPKWNMDRNPLYEPATTTVSNPAFSSP